jgi:HAD superfamily hydrolase (TIGR01509 family)
MLVELHRAAADPLAFFVTSNDDRTESWTMDRPKGVLLDLDGTFIDSNDVHARAWVEALGEAGYRVSFENMRRLIGKGGDKVLPQVTGLEKESTRGKRIGERRGEIFKEKYLPHLLPFPQARALLERMHQDGLLLVAATSAKEDEMNALIELTGGAQFFHKAISSTDAPRSKPDPDIVEAALQRAAISAAEALMLGDTPYDIQAAGAAGVRTVAVRSGGWSDADLQGAIAIYDDVADLLARYGESPLAR